MRGGRHASASLLGLLLTVLTGPARAQPSRAAPSAAPAPPLAARLEYTRDAAAARCADAAALQDAVSRQLGAPVFEREPPTHLVRVQITGVRRGLRAQIEVRSADGTPLGAREIDSRSSDCAELSSALALAIAIAIDPTRLFAPSAPPPSPAPAPACPAPIVCPVCPPRTPASPPPPDDGDDGESSVRGFSIAAGGAVGIGALPAVSGAGVFELAARFTRASVQLALVLHPGASGGELVDSSDDEPVDAQLLLGELGLCGRLALDAAWTFAACALGSAGALRGSGPAGGEREATFTSAAGAQARIERDLTGPVFAELRAELQANLVRTTLNVGGMPAWTTPPVWGQLGVLAGLRFP